MAPQKSGSTWQAVPLDGAEVLEALDDGGTYTVNVEVVVSPLVVVDVAVDVDVLEKLEELEEVDVVTLPPPPPLPDVRA